MIGQVVLMNFLKEQLQICCGSMSNKFSVCVCHTSSLWLTDLCIILFITNFTRSFLEIRIRNHGHWLTHTLLNQNRFCMCVGGRGVGYLKIIYLLNSCCIQLQLLHNHSTIQMQNTHAHTDTQRQIVPISFCVPYSAHTAKIQKSLYISTERTNLWKCGRVIKTGWLFK